MSLNHWVIAPVPAVRGQARGGGGSVDSGDATGTMGRPVH